jgi:hypothetical protein
MTIQTPNYFTVTEAPNLRFFRCERLRATVSDRSCGTNFRRSQNLRPDTVASCAACATCELGAKHAGVEFKRRSGMHGLAICSRCRRHSMRQIGGLLCPSCYNRALELKKGRNAKNTMPTMAPLLARRIGAVIDGKPMTLRAEKSRDATELVVAVLRFAEGRLLFCRPRRGPVVTLADWVDERRPRNGLSAQLSPALLRDRARHASASRRAAAAEVPMAAAE